MCDQAAIITDLRVSIQLRGADDRVSGHLSAGILGDANLVLVPNPPESMLQGDIELECLIVPVTGPPEQLEIAGKIERFPCRKLTGFGFEENGQKKDRPEMIIVTLSEFSRYHSQLGDFDEAAIVEEFADTEGDWWAALEIAEAIPAGIHELSDEFLGRVSEGEKRHCRHRRMDFFFTSWLDLVAATCRPLCKC
jgi:hypothetical protein